jgi:hypothetical protein
MYEVWRMAHGCMIYDVTIRVHAKTIVLVQQ